MAIAHLLLFSVCFLSVKKWAQAGNIEKWRLVKAQGSFVFPLQLFSSLLWRL
jgi:hypothetical protein